MVSEQKPWDTGHIESIRLRQCSSKTLTGVSQVWWCCLASLFENILWTKQIVYSSGLTGVHLQVDWTDDDDVLINFKYAVYNSVYMIMYLYYMDRYMVHIGTWYDLPFLKKKTNRTRSILRGPWNQPERCLARMNKKRFYSSRMTARVAKKIQNIPVSTMWLESECLNATTSTRTWSI